MEQTSSLFCTCNSCVARCQSQRQFHFLRMNSMFVRNLLHGQVSLAAVNQVCVIHVDTDVCKNLKIHLEIRACFENVNI